MTAMPLEPDSRFVPLDVTIELGHKCNFACGHCYNFDRSSNSASGRQSIWQQDNLIGIVDQLDHAGCLSVTFTGGEPLIYPFIYPVIENIRARHMAVFVKSNGAMCNDRTIGMLENARCMGIEISLYGASPQTSDTFTRSVDGFARTVRGLELLAQSSINTKLTLVMTRINAHEASAMLSLAESFGFEYTINTHLSGRYDGSCSSLDYRLTEDQLWNLYAGPFRRHVPERSDCAGVESVQCGCALSLCAINAQGDVYPCIGAPLVAGNVFRQTFAHIWQHSTVFRRIRNLKLSDFKACGSCPDRSYCRRSSGEIYATTGNYTGAESWTCMEAAIIRRVNESNLSTGVKAPPAKEVFHAPPN